MIGTLELDMVELAAQDNGDLVDRIAGADGHVRLSFTLPDAYSSTSKWELARSWLKGWYIAERIAACCFTVSHQVKEGARGAVIFKLDVEVADEVALAAVVGDLAPAFDPDNLEAEAELGAAAETWLERRGAVQTRFPDVEQAYRDDVEAAEGSEIEDE